MPGRTRPRSGRPSRWAGSEVIFRTACSRVRMPSSRTYDRRGSEGTCPRRAGGAARRRGCRRCRPCAPGAAMIARTFSSLPMCEIDGARRARSSATSSQQKSIGRFPCRRRRRPRRVLPTKRRFSSRRTPLMTMQPTSRRARRGAPSEPVSSISTRMRSRSVRVAKASDRGVGPAGVHPAGQVRVQGGGAGEVRVRVHA